MQRRSILLMILFIFFVILLLIPIIIENSGAELVPQEFGVTATLYVATEDAQRTREYEIERSATSIIITIPVDDEPLPGDPDYTPPAGDGYNPNGTIRFVQYEPTLPVTSITIVASRDFEIYSCPDSSAATATLIEAGETFEIIGWSTDDLGVTYLLTDQSVDTMQTWIRIINLDELLTAAQLATLPTVDCVVEAASEAQASPTFDPDNPPLPMAITATPVWITAQIVITNESAVDQFAELISEIENPDVSITEELITITGVIDIQMPLGGTIQGDVVIEGNLEPYENERGLDKLRFDITSLTVSGRNYTDTPEEQEVEFTIDNWLTDILVGRDVTSFEQNEGEIFIDVLQPPDIELTAEVTEDISMSDVTVTVNPNQVEPTSTPIPIRTATLAPRGTPLPVRTLDPNSTEPTGASSEQTSGETRIEESEATSDAVMNLNGVGSASVFFESNNTLTVTGFFNPGGLIGNNVPFSMSGSVNVQNGEVQFVPQSLTVANQTINVNQYPFLGDNISAWVTQLVGSNVSDLSIENGEMIINRADD